MVVLDVVEEILSRLLVKDLLRCKSVCKSWYSLISSPSFVKTHCKFMRNNEDINTRRIAMIPQEYVWSMQGSSNGLVCLYYYTGYEHRIIVTNPLTREFRELAQPPVFPGRDWYTQSLGFGYDTSTDDYKVVRAICHGGITLVHILSLKSNIWKLLGQINYRCFHKPGILFNGALYWFWFEGNDTRDDKVLIVSFDLVKEEFREIPQPDDTRYFWNYYYSLGIIKGRLCITSSYDHSIWVMKNYNGKPSWERLPIEMKDHAIHYMPPPPTYFCDENIQLSRSEEHISSPIFVQTLVSPYVKDCKREIQQDKPQNRETEEEEKEEW